MGQFSAGWRLWFKSEEDLRLTPAGGITFYAGWRLHLTSEEDVSFLRPRKTPSFSPSEEDALVSNV